MLTAPFKAGAWWSHKIPPMLAVAYAALAFAPQPPHLTETAKYFALYLLAVIATAAFGHLVTDAFDVEEDRVLGKPNLWSTMPVPARWVIVAVLLLLSWLPWLAMPGGRFLALLIAAQFLMFFAYAAPPLRLKERGLAGIVADALYAHALPALWTWVPFSVISGIQVPAWMIALLALWSVSVGMRHLLQHQVADLNADRLAGVATHAVRKGRDATLGLIVRPILVVEFFAFCCLLIIVGSRIWFVPACFLAFGAVRVMRMRGGSPAWWRDDAELSAQVGTLILTRFYERWLPLLILVGLVLRDPSYILLLVAHLLLFGRGILELLRDDVPRIASILTARRNGAAAAGVSRKRA